MLGDEPPCRGEHSHKRCVRDQLQPHYTTFALHGPLTACYRGRRKGISSIVSVDWQIPACGAEK